MLLSISSTEQLSHYVSPFINHIVGSRIGVMLQPTIIKPVHTFKEIRMSLDNVHFKFLISVSNFYQVVRD